jgi:hypothetical protein
VKSTTFTPFKEVKSETLADMESPLLKLSLSRRRGHARQLPATTYHFSDYPWNWTLPCRMVLTMEDWP